MKRILKGVILTLIVILSSACMSNIKKLSYTEFNEYFSNKKGFHINDSTGHYDIEIRRFLEAGNGDFQITYIEFDNEKSADEYVKTMYKDTSKYKVKSKKDVTFVKENKPSFLRLYKKDNVIVSGITNNKKARREVKRVLRDLGY